MIPCEVLFSVGFISSLTADPKAWPVSPTASVSATLAFRGSPGLGKPKLLPEKKRPFRVRFLPFLETCHLRISTCQKFTIEVGGLTTTCYT